MLHKLRPRLTYASVVATLALFVALGGSSYAVSKIGSAQIKDNSIRGKDIRNNDLSSSDVENGSLLGADFKANQLPAGPRGVTGAPGSKGDKGDPGAPATKLFAHVANNNLTSAAQGATALEHRSRGEYFVRFNRDLTGCVAFAQIGFVNPFAGGTAGDLNAVTHVFAGGSVGVTIVRPGVGPDNSAFNLVVFC